MVLYPGDMYRRSERLSAALIAGLVIGMLFAPATAGKAAEPRKVALVLSGGGARGAAHIGALRAFEREGIRIDVIVGTSFGALVGGLYATGRTSREIEGALSSQDWSRIFSDDPERRLSPLLQRRNARYQTQVAFEGWVPEIRSGLRNGQRLTEELDLLTSIPMLNAGYDFDRLPIPFRAVATNLVDGRPYIFSRGTMTEALRASMAIPLVFTPLEKGDMLLVDGGLVDNLPTDVARDLGADVIIAVDATSPLLEKDEINNFVDVIDQSISLQMEKNVRENRALATVLIRPMLDGMSATDYERIPEILERGEAAVGRAMDEIRAALAASAPSPSAPSTRVLSSPTIESVTFRGLARIRSAQLAGEVETHPGQKADPRAIDADVRRLYATRLFERVSYILEPIEEGRCRLVFMVEEAPFKWLGAGLRYDSDYDFVALAEFTARQLFGTTSTAIVSTQFGGLENHFASLRLIPTNKAPLFIEPRGDVLRQQRLDIRNKRIFDTFTDEREGGRVLVGGSLFKQLEVAGGYRIERVRVEGGSEPNRLIGSDTIAGLTFRLNQDSLDFRDFPRSGMSVRMQVDKRSKEFGSDLSYSKWEADAQRYFSVSPNSTFRLHTTLGYSHGPVPFYDLFYIGGYSFSQLASRQFLGLERDELALRHVAILGASYRRQIFSSPLGFLRRGYITGIYNVAFASNRETSPYDFDLVHGAGIGVAMDTIVGPVRVTAGWGEGGRANFYFTLGPSF